MADRTITIYVSSPGDVLDERIALLEVVRRLEYDPFLGRAADLRVVSWDDPAAPVPMLGSEPPQATVDSLLGKPSECDIFIALFWSRMGTPLAGGPYRSGTEWEVADALAGGGTDVVVYRKTALATVALGAPDWADKARQYEVLRSYLADLSGRLDGRGSVQEFDTLDDFRVQVDAHLRHLIARRVRSWSVHDRTPAWNRARSPYPGLVAFTPTDSDVFFGRDTEVDALVKLVRRAPLTAVVGASGSGKSSVIGAGLLPRLAALPGGGPPPWLVPRFEGGVWHGPWITPASGGGDPLRSLALALRPGDVPGSPAELCRQVLDASGGATLPLIVVDQFEEVFGAVGVREREAFVDTLVALADDGLATVVLSLRADFLGPALEHDGLARHLRTATLPLGPPGLAAIRTMIAEPARVAGLRFDDDLPELLLVHTRQEPGRLPLLAFALAELYRLREGDRLTHEGYTSIGGVRGAVGKLAERSLRALPESLQGELDALFPKLVEVDEVGGPVRRKLRLADLHADEGRAALVDALTSARLLVVGGEKDQQPFVELAHEALFRGWPRLTTWIDHAHESLLALGRMRRAAEEWQRAGRDPLFLWPAERMAPVRDAVERLDAELTDDERAFLRPELDRLLDELARPDTDHGRRREISARLAALGDPRPGVGLRADGVPDIAWCRVDRPSGAPLWVAKYPVTSAQLDAFRRRLVRDFPASSGLESLPGNVPVAVTWTEAAGFCRWLDAQSGVRPEDCPPGYAIRLPYEHEWVAAAQRQPYPWGDEFDESRANTASSLLGTALAVGVYPRGDASNGVSDLVGNVWEWCSDEAESAGPGGPGGPYLFRLLKGGSAMELTEVCRVDVRRFLRGDVTREDRGFRLCLGPTDNPRRTG
jgi:hypothetical protein